MAVEAKYNRHLAQLFSRNILSSISEGKFLQSVAGILEVSGYFKNSGKELVVEDFFEELYDYLLENYRCEYLYKNILTNEILNQYHCENSHILTEFRAGNCLADFVVLNGTSCVYEIKTELDTFDRLDRQIAAYRKLFDKIYIVTHYSCLSKLQPLVDDDIGIIYLDERYLLRKEREAVSNKSNVNPEVIFDSLRLSEYTTLLIRQLGYFPQVPSAVRYNACRELTERLPPEIVHDEMVLILKKRLPAAKIESAISEIPRSLKLLYLENKFTIKQTRNFFSNMRQKYYL